jgi:PTS system ascorbate-specific IIA component
VNTTKNSTLQKLLTREVVKLGVVGLKTPQEVIAYGGSLLEAAGKVNKQYIKDMILAYESLGPYIVMAPGLAMPHARPGGNVVENGISFLQLKTPVEFQHSSNDPVKIVITLAGASDNGHIDLLQDLSSFLGREGVIEQLSQITSYEELMKMI